jgi:hypothetical protein
LNTASKQKCDAVSLRHSVALDAAKTPVRAEAGSKKGHAYKPLPTQFRRDSFDYRQIAREGSAAIYEQTWSGCSEPSVGYDVIRVRYRDGFHIGGRFVEAAEVYPNCEAWGVDGWTFQDEAAAIRKLREVLGRDWG